MPYVNSYCTMMHQHDRKINAMTKKSEKAILFAAENDLTN